VSDARGDRLLGALALALPGTMLLGVALAGARGRPRIEAGDLAEPAFAVAGAIAMALGRRVRQLIDPATRRATLERALGSLADWAPFIGAIALYAALDHLAARGAQPTADGALLAMDRALFGIEPAQVAERLAHPLLTELAAGCYALYLPLPLAIAACLALADRRADFRELVAVVTFTLVTGFVLYLAVPTDGPRRFMAGQFQRPLAGAFGFYEWSEASWDALQRVRHDAFPSLHTAMATVALVYAFRFRDASRALGRRLGRPWLLPLVIAPPAIGLIVSTVYLRMHYLVDVIAGAALAGIACAVVPWARRLIEERTAYAYAYADPSAKRTPLV
jgi:membrane-associated phospholipid phosphatase